MHLACDKWLGGWTSGSVEFFENAFIVLMCFMLRDLLSLRFADDYLDSEFDFLGESLKVISLFFSRRLGLICFVILMFDSKSIGSN